MSVQFKRLLPLFNRVLVTVAEAQKKTASGIILTENTDQSKYGQVVEVGPGNLDQNGKLVPISVKVGDTVLLPDFGGQKVKLNNKEYQLFRDTDILGILQ